MQRPHQSRSTVWYTERGTFKQRLQSTDRLTEHPWVSNTGVNTCKHVSVSGQTRLHEL